MLIKKPQQKLELGNSNVNNLNNTDDPVNNINFIIKRLFKKRQGIEAI